VIVSLSLLTYALVLAWAGPRLLMRGAWTDRAPRLGIVAWQSVSSAVVVAVVLGGAALVMPTVRFSTDLADLLRACAMALRAQYATPGGLLVTACGAALALGVLGRTGCCVLAAMAGAARQRARHRDVLVLAGRSRPGVGATVLEGDEPAVYCLPGRRRRIVVTSAALALLDDDQLAAALAHERAHLRQRHDLVIARRSPAQLTTAQPG